MARIAAASAEVAELGYTGGTAQEVPVYTSSSGRADRLWVPQQQLIENL